MPLPQKVVDRLSRETVDTPGWSSQLLLFSGGIFFVCVFIYFGVVFGYQPYIEKQGRKLNDTIKAFSEQIPVAEQSKIASFYSQVSNIKNLLDKHVAPSAVFKWLEKNTQSNVYYKSLSADIDNGRISLSASGRSLADVEEQLVVFENSKDVKSASFSSVQKGEKGEWGFNGTLYLAPEFFLSKIENSQ